MKERLVRSTLRVLGVPVHHTGYTYLVEAISEVIDDHTIVYGIVKGLYTKLADRYDVSVTSVERCIRHSVQTSFEKAPRDVKFDIFGNTEMTWKAPSNRCYIATVADYIRDSMRCYGMYGELSPIEGGNDDCKQTG